MSADPELQVIETRHGPVSYREAGRGEVLLLLHGLGGNSRSWREQYAALGGRYRVIGWDAPGYGQSSLVDTDCASYAQAAIDFLDALGIETANVLGHSMGGVMATRMAAMAPNRVRRLVLSCTFLGDTRPADEPLAEGYRMRIADRRAMDDAAFGQARMPSMVGDAASDEIRATVADIAGGVTAEGLEAACKMLHHAGNASVAGDVSVPVLVISGGADKVMPMSRVEPLIAALGNCRTHSFDTAGHAPYLEVPDAYNRLLVEFLGG